ncbi:MAG: YqgE/AlgH family protein [Cellvibrionaceae bacterium]
MGQKHCDKHNHLFDQPQLSDSSCEIAEGGLRNQFLIAMPSLTDSTFAHTITYICEHNAEGALGFVINHPLDIKLNEIYQQLELDDLSTSQQQEVLCGGPLQPENGFILHSNDKTFESSLTISSDICLTASKDVLVEMAKNNGPEKAIVALGYAGWSPGQLEKEISENAWLTVPADPNIIFDVPCEQRWASVSKYLGIDLNLIHSTAGHA